MTPPSDVGQTLESIYAAYHHRRYVHPDPLEFLYQYDNWQDREIAGFIAASLAYGRVGQILKSTAAVLNPMGASPYMFLKESSEGDLRSVYSAFTHRFATGSHMTALLCGIKDVVKTDGSLRDCFLKGMTPGDDAVLPGICRLAGKIIGGRSPGHLVPVPELGSACKRINLFLRWMIRKDEVDPGGWDQSLMSKLIVPLDTHLHRISLFLGLTTRKQSNMKTASEITEAFRKIRPDDPARYDFSLTRIGIRGEKFFGTGIIPI